MENIKIVSFKEALKMSDSNKRHLLLGNGFSIAYRRDIFSYKNLFKEADFSSVSENAKRVFEKFDIYDFEIVIRKLRDTKQVLEVYRRRHKDKSLLKLLEKDADGLKEILVRTLTYKHPDLPSRISESQYKACIKFLSNFIEKGSHIFTLNYDLLLYWVLIKGWDMAVFDSRNIDDGFRPGEEGEDYVVWEPSEAKNQKVYYLHGALHLFDDGLEIKKYTWSRTDIPLMQQIREAVSNDIFPLFVAEGTSDSKMTRINHSAYLGKGIRSFAGIGGDLFIYGHSLSKNDSHILDYIGKSKIVNLFISIYGNPESKQNRNTIKKAQLIKMSRSRHDKRNRYPLNIIFYNAESAKVWG